MTVTRKILRYLIARFHRHGAGALSDTSSARFDQNSANAGAGNLAPARLPGVAGWGYPTRNKSFRRHCFSAVSRQKPLLYLTDHTINF